MPGLKRKIKEYLIRFDIKRSLEGRTRFLHWGEERQIDENLDEQLKKARLKLAEAFGEKREGMNPLRPASEPVSRIRAENTGVVKQEKAKKIEKLASSDPRLEALSEITKKSKYKREYLGYLVRQKKLKAQKVGGTWKTTLEWVRDFEREAEKKKTETKKELSKKMGEGVGVLEAVSEIWEGKFAGTRRLAEIANQRKNILFWKARKSWRETRLELEKIFALREISRPLAALAVLVVLIALANITRADLATWRDEAAKGIALGYNAAVEKAAAVAKPLEKIKISRTAIDEITNKIIGRKKVRQFEEKTGLSLTGPEEQRESVVEEEGIVAGEEMGRAPNHPAGAGATGQGIVLAETSNAGNVNVGDIEVSAYVLGDEGRPVTNGDYQVRFSLYSVDRAESDPYPSDADRGSRVWEETQTISVQDGLLNGYLGKTTPIPESLDFGSKIYYLGIRIGEDAELVPRKRIGAVPLARTALAAQTLSGYTVGNASGNIPVSNGTLNTNLNAQYLEGMQAGDFVQTGDTTFGYQSWKLAVSSSDAGQKIKNNKAAVFVGAGGIVTSRSLNTLTISPTYGSTDDTIAEGSTPLVISTTGNLQGGGTGTSGGGISLTLDTIASPTFTDVTAGGNLNLTAPANLIFGGTTSLGETTAATDSGAYLVGVFSAGFINSASTNVQDVLSDFDAAIAGGGPGSMWTLSVGGVIYPTDATNDLTIGGSTLAASIFGIDESTGNFYFGYDNSANPTFLFEATGGQAGTFGFNANDAFYFSGANVGIDTTNPSSFKLEVAGDIGPEADNTRNLGSPGRYFNTAYISNIVTGGSGTVGYWSRAGTTLSPVTNGDAVAIYAGAGNTSGTLLGISYTAAATLNGTLYGGYIDLNDGFVTPTNQSVTGLRVVLPTTTNTNAAGTITYNGMSLGYGVGTGINQNGAGETIYNGASLLIPALTQTAGTLTANGVLVTTSSSITTGGTANGIKIAATGVGAGTLNGIYISGITGSGGAETAVNIGSGWDSVLSVNGSQVINGSGVVPAAAGGTGLTSYAVGDLIYATGATTLSNLVAGVGNNGKILVVSGGVPTWGVMSGSACTDCVLNDPTAEATQTIIPNNQDISSLVVRQTTFAVPTQNIFEVTNSNGSSVYFYVDQNGNVSTGGVASQTLTLTPTSDTTALTLVGTNVPTASLQYINSKNTQGTIFNMAYGAAQTLAGTLIGQKIDLATNVTATDQSVTGLSITLPAVTNTTSTSYYKGLVVSGPVGGGINQNGAGTTVFSGVDVTIPALTQTAGTLTGNGILITTPSSITTGGTANGLNIAATGVGAGTLRGINIGNITAGAGAETGIYVGTGWDYSAIFMGGNVGIGTSNPSNLLDIKPTSGATSGISLKPDYTYADNTKFQYQFKHSNNTVLGYLGYNYYVSGTDILGMTLMQTQAYPLIFGTSGTEQMRITSSGSVGIGTTSPGTILHIYGSNPEPIIERSNNSQLTMLAYKPNGAYSSSNVLWETGMGSGESSYIVRTWTGSDNNYYLAITNSGSMGLGGNITNRSTLAGATMVITGGYVGIGITSPLMKLDVYGAPTSAVLARFRASSDTRNALAVYNSTYYMQFGTYESTNTYYAGANSGFVIAETGLSLVAQGANPMVFATNGSINTGANERMRIDSAGNVGIGTTSPTHKLHIVDTDTTASRAALYVSQTGVITGTGYAGYFAKTGASTTNIALYASAANATNNYAIYAEAGGVLIGSTAWPTSVSGLASGRLALTQINGNSQIILHDDTAVAAGTGPGGLTFSGRTNDTGPAYSAFAFITAKKENASQGDSKGYLKFSVNNGSTINNEVMRINSSGYVGIGTTSPGVRLSVVGNGYETVSLDSTGTGTWAQLFVGTDTADMRLITGTISGEAKTAIGSYTNYPLALETNGNEKMRITTGGSVGIGTTNPLGLLHINASAYNDLSKGLVFGDGDTGFYESADDNLRFAIAGSAKFILGDGEYFRSASTSGAAMRNVTPTVTTPGILASVADIDTGMGWAGENILSLIAGGTNVLNVTSGNVGIGTTNPGAALQVVGSILASGLAPGGNASLDLQNYNIGGTVTSAIRMAAGNMSYASMTDVVKIVPGMQATSGTVGVLTIKPTYNQTGTASSTDLLINRTVTAVGSSAQNFLDMQAGGTSWYKFATGNTATTGGFNAASGTEYGATLSPIINQSGTAGWIGLYVNPTLTAVGSGPQVSAAFMGGSVGIGTTSPGARLQVNQSGAATAANYGASVYNTATSSTDSINKYGVFISSTGTWNGIGAVNYGLYVDTPTGGTTNVTALFHGSLGDVSINDQGAILGFSRSGANYITASGASGSLAIQTGGSNTRLAIDSSGNVGIGSTASSSPTLYVTSGGNVGIGTTNPGANLEVYDTTAGEGIRLTNTGTYGWMQFNEGTTTRGYLGYGDSGNIFTGASSDSLSLRAQGDLHLGGTGDNLTMTIKDRLVGIGTTGPAYTLDVKASGTGVIARFNSDNNSGCSLAADGTITCTSDIRLKENITNTNYGLDTVMALRPVEYNWKFQKTTTRKSLGFIAQEVEEVIPGLVITDANGYKELNTIGLIPVLAKALQEQQTMINEQGSVISEQQSEISNFKFQISKQASDVGELQTAVNEKLTLVSNSLSALDIRTTASENNISNLKTRLTSAETKLQEAESNIATFETATNDTLSAMLETENMLTQRVMDHEERLAYLEAKLSAMTITGGDPPAGGLPDNVLVQDENGNVSLAGIFESKEVIAGAYSVKNDDSEKKTMGEEMILTGESEKIVATKAISSSAKIFVTFEGDPGARFWTEKTTDPETGEFSGFRVKLSASAASEVKFSWWVVQQR